ncbi:MAG: hypothetical protein JJE04_03000 [Acidobacteriia bacterium]|nr:hypothetical protein [Terriglobia bacterium]
MRTCLAKEAGERWQTARDLLAELEWVAAGGGATSLPVPIPVVQVKTSRLSLAVAAVLAAALAVPAFLYFRGASPPEELRFRDPSAGLPRLLLFPAKRFTCTRAGISMPLRMAGRWFLRLGQPRGPPCRCSYARSALCPRSRLREPMARRGLSGRTTAVQSDSSPAGN